MQIRSSAFYPWPPTDNVTIGANVSIVFCISRILPVVTSRSTSHSTVLRGSCLYNSHFRSGLSATVIKEYCIV